ncbi:MAG: hypothetical protein SFW67_37195 [Myxococcaceae bacterium]|nr:hypothetical protein [Myxococcaceae bacterium]
MFPDVLRSVAGPMLNSLNQVANAARPPAAAPAPAQKPGGLQVLDGFDDPLPAVQRAAQTAAPTATGGVEQAAAAQGQAAGQDALAQNPIAKLVELFSNFIKQFFSMFFGGQGAQGGEGQAPAVGGAAGAGGAPRGGAAQQVANALQGGAEAAANQPRIDGDRAGDAAPAQGPEARAQGVERAEPVRNGREGDVVAGDNSNPGSMAAGRAADRDSVPGYAGQSQRGGSMAEGRAVDRDSVPGYSAAGPAADRDSVPGHAGQSQSSGSMAEGRAADRDSVAGYTSPSFGEA